MPQLFLRFDQMATYPVPIRQHFLSIQSWPLFLAASIDYASCLKLILILAALIIAQASYSQTSESLVVNNAT
ncbi:MAG: hypothetical protein QNK38_03395 [Nitrospirota bacterium]|nr:hypothetical protein [Nitrospirota bacterium]